MSSLLGLTKPWSKPHCRESTIPGNDSADINVITFFRNKGLKELRSGAIFFFVSDPLLRHESTNFATICVLTCEANFKNYSGVRHLELNKYRFRGGTFLSEFGMKNGWFELWQGDKVVLQCDWLNLLY